MVRAACRFKHPVAVGWLLKNPAETSFTVEIEMTPAAGVPPAKSGPKKQ